MCHVLLIEDDFFVSDYIESIVRKAGGTSVTIVTTENEAVAAAANELPGIILSDVRLTQGTGPKAVEAIMRRHGELPVIFITGTPEECEPCDPPSIVLSKPVNEAQVTHAFKTLAPL